VFPSASRARRPAGGPPPPPVAPDEPGDALPGRAMDPGAVLLALLGSPKLSSRHAVFEQYDSHVQANTVAGPAAGPP